MTELSRRTFIQLSVISTAAASMLAGCKNEDVWKEEATGQYGGTSNKVFPYVNQPDGQVDGVPTYFATTCQMCGAGCGLYVRTLGGRANTVHGNPDHPVNLGRTCLRGQLALQHMYNPDRLMKPMMRQSRSEILEETTWQSAYFRTATALDSARGKTALLVDGDTVGRSPTKLALLEKLRATVGGTLQEYTLVDDAPWRAAALSLYGRNQLPDYRIDLADVVVSFGGNFLEAWPSPVHYAALFGEFRQGKRRTPGNHGLFVYVGPRQSMTAAKADLWLPCRAGTENYVAQGVLHELGFGGMTAEDSSSITGLSVQQIRDLASVIVAARHNAVAIGGDGLFSSPLVTQAFLDVEQINVAIKSHCVRFGNAQFETPAVASGAGSLQSLISDISSGKVGALVIVGECNPAYSYPASSWSDTIKNVPFVLSINCFLNETTSGVDVTLPARTFLEEWTDQIPSVLPSNIKLACLNQPVIDPVYITRRHQIDSNNGPVPLMDTREMSVILSDLITTVNSKTKSANGSDLVKQSWLTKSAEDPDGSSGWIDTVSRGGKWTYEPVPALKAATVIKSVRTVPAQLTKGEFGLLLYPHIYFGDGRHANLDWAQEMPDPITSAVWNNWLEINAASAHHLGIRTGDIIRVTGPGGSVELPALPTQGIHPDVVAVPLGQGHTSYGRNASGTGVNILSVVGAVIDPFTGSYAFSAVTVTIQKMSDAVAGYHANLKTLVLVEDRPHGAEPPAVKDLIHETAKEWKTQQIGPKVSPDNEQRERPVL